MVERTFLRRTAFMRETGTPIWIGEFGPVYDGDLERDRSRLRLLRDQLDIYREHGASWALWTYKDAHIRQVLDPIEDLFDKEFPGFDPSPWGRRAWLQTLVRNIMLAEPMVGDFGRCFEGVGPEEAERLAGCFAFDACERREPLADVLRTHLAAG